MLCGELIIQPKECNLVFSHYFIFIKKFIVVKRYFCIVEFIFYFSWFQLLRLLGDPAPSRGYNSVICNSGQKVLDAVK